MTEELSEVPPQSHFDEQDALALLVPRAKVLAALADACGQPGAAVPLAKPVDIAINHYSEALAMHSPLAQPVLYVSPEQLAEHSDDGPEHGRYLPARKTPAGKFTQPLYAGAPWLPGRYPHLPQSVGDVTDFGEGKVDIDWGHPAPAGGTRLYSAEQMRSYVDADRAARAEQSAAVAGPAISDEDRMTLAGALGLLRGHRYDGSADALQRVLDANAAAPAAPAVEAPAAPSEADIASAREHIADVHNATQMRSALSQLRPEVVVELVARGLVPSIYAPMAAAPQAPAAPVGLPWRTGIPPWTDDRSVRVIAVTAHDDFGGVQVHDIRASDFHTDGDGDGAEVASVCTHWAYRDEIWPRADAVAPAAPIPWDNFPAYLIDHCEGQTITEEGLQRALSAMLANPQYAGTAPAAPADAEMLAALQAVAADVVHVGAGENTISDAARAKVEAVLEKIGAPWPSPEAAPAAPAVDARDTARMNWLEAQVVNVRAPLRYGSRDLFWASPEEVDGGPDGPSDLRARIDAAQAKEGGEA